MKSEIIWVKQDDEDNLSICVDVTLYSLDALFRACYSFTDRCYLFLEPGDRASSIKVSFTRKSGDSDMKGLIGDFATELLNQQVRRVIAAETETVRDLIVAQAFTEADLLGQELMQASYIDDPKGISQ